MKSHCLSPILALLLLCLPAALRADELDVVESYPTDLQIAAADGSLSPGTSADDLKINGYFGDGAMEFTTGAESASLEFIIPANWKPGDYTIGLFGRISHHPEARTIKNYRLTVDGAPVELREETPEIITHAGMEYGTVLSTAPVALKPGTKLAVSILTNNHSLNRILIFSVGDPFDAISKVNH